MALELGSGLRAKGQKVVYVTSLWGSGEFGQRLSEVDFPFYEMRLGFLSATLNIDCIRMTADQVLRWPSLLYHYSVFLKREQPHRVIHTNWHHALLLWSFLRPERDIFWLHEVVPDKPQYVWLFTTMARHLRFYVVVSEAVGAALRRLGVPSEKIRLIRNGIADPWSGSPKRLRATTGFDIGIVGQVGAWKGHEDLLEAFGIITGQYPMARLHVFGDYRSEFAQRLVQKTKDDGVFQRVVWHGYISDRSDIYHSMDICVVPSRSADPLPTSAIEAAFFGLPVVATRNGGLPEIVVDGITGFLIDEYSPSQLADRLGQLLANTQLRYKMGAAAREHATRDFSRQRFIDDFWAQLFK